MKKRIGRAVAFTRAMRKRNRLAKKQKELEAKLLRAMDGANARGFTGYLGSKGSLFDDPQVKKAKKQYDAFLDKVK
jgi:hypothetical protein